MYILNNIKPSDFTLLIMLVLVEINIWLMCLKSHQGLIEIFSLHQIYFLT